MTTPVQILLEVCKAGGYLRLAGDKLLLGLPTDCSSEFKLEIHRHKTALLRLLRSTFLIVESRVLNEIVFFVTDEETRRSLVKAGAKHGNIYTRSELGVLVKRQISADELRLVHAAKQRFNGAVTR